MDINIFATRLHYLRSRNNYTLKELAEKVGCTHGAISHMENGKRYPKFKTLEALCEIFDVDISYLLGTSDHEKPEDRFNAATKIVDRLVEYGIIKKDSMLDIDQADEIIKAIDTILKLNIKKED